MHMLHKNYPLCVNITPAYDRISKIRARSRTRHQLNSHICEAQHVRMRCVSCRWFTVKLDGTSIATMYLAKVLRSCESEELSEMDLILRK